MPKLGVQVEFKRNDVTYKVFKMHSQYDITLRNVFGLSFEFYVKDLHHGNKGSMMSQCHS